MIAGRSRILLAMLAVGCLVTATAASADVARMTPPAAGPIEAPQGAAVNWIDHFDLYATGSQMHGQGGWEGWANDPAAGALTTSAQAQSAPNSVEIVGATDLVHQYSGYVTGQGTWVYTAYWYIPTGGSGQTYFIMLNTYTNDPACTNCNWSVQVNADLATGVLTNDGASGGTGTVIRDAWVPVVLVINLDSDTQTFFYNNIMLYTGSWSQEVSGGGAVNIACVDLFANGSTAVYFDDISLSNLPFLDGFEVNETNEWHHTIQ